MLHPTLERERRAITSFLAASAQDIAEVLPRLANDPDIEVLHRLRVGLRRIRTVLKALDAALPSEQGAALAAQCAWLAGRSSRLRDIDVLQQWLQDNPGAQTAFEADPEGARSIRAALARLRSRERRALLSSCRSRRAQTLVAQLQALGSISAFATGWPARALAQRALGKAHRAVLKHGQAITAASPAQELHELRKRCKRLRYLLEMYAYAGERSQLEASIARMRKLQNVLGELQDMHNHALLLQELSTPAEAALVAALEAGFAARVQHAREKFDNSLRRFASGKQHRRLKALLRPEPGLQHPWVGSAGYCHGQADGSAIALPVGKIVCVGRNYAAHALELGNAVPEIPLLFVKPPSALVDFAPFIRVPTTQGSVHHELEIALLIGRELRHATPAQARSAIVGIGLAIDLTLREVQDGLKANRHPWEIAKGFDASCPVSGFVPLDPALDLRDIELRLAVNDRRRQFGSSAQMLTPIVELLCYASTHFSLWPGDVLLSGTPQGVGPLRPGDKLSAVLGDLLRLRTVVCE